MHNGCVDRDQKIELFEDRRRIGKVAHAFADIDDQRIGAKPLRLIRTVAFLQTDEPDLGHLQERNMVSNAIDRLRLFL